MSRAGTVRMPVEELTEKQTLLTIETDEQENFIKGRQKVKVHKFPQEKVDFLLSLTNELSSPSALKPCYCTFCRDGCYCSSPVSTRRRSNILGSRDKDKVYIKLDLSFENYLHEMSHNYKYRITCNVRLKKFGQLQKICSFEAIRTTKTMNFLINSDHCMDCMVKELHGALIYVEIERFCIKPNFPLNKFQSDFRALLDNPVHSDVTLQVGQLLMKAHKNILSCRSVVFQAMFNCEMRENQTGIVNIVDVLPEVMRELLCYIYTGSCKNLDKMPIDLFEAAAKYQLDDLKTECIEYLIFRVNPENIVKLSKLVEMYDVVELGEKISAFMKKYKRVVRKTN